jgi:N-acetylneuraminic acid mutarotase
MKRKKLFCNILVFGGDNDRDKETFSIFLSLEKMKRKWKEKQLQPFRFPRCCFGVVSFDNFIFIIGGFDGNRSIASVECYDTVFNQWTIYPNIHKRRSSCLSLFCDKKIYVVGGVAKSRLIKEIEEFDLQTGCWKVITKDILPTSGSGGVIYNKKMYIFGGLRQDGDITSNLSYYDLVSDTWKILQPMKQNRSSFGYCLYFLENKPIIVVAGGSNTKTNLTETCEYYDILDGKWETMGDLHLKCRYCSLVCYQEKLYMVGGNDGNNCLGTMESYNFNTQKWSIEYKNKQNIFCGQGVLSYEDILLEKKSKNKIVINSTVSWEGKFYKNKRDGLFLRKEGDITTEFYFFNNVIVSKEKYEFEISLKNLVIPRDFVCPISMEMMRDPVVTSIGNTYDRQYIEQWLISNNTDPLTNITIEPFVFPNILIKKLILNFVQTEKLKKKTS